MVGVRGKEGDGEKNTDRGNNTIKFKGLVHSNYKRQNKHLLISIHADSYGIVVSYIFEIPLKA